MARVASLHCLRDRIKSCQSFIVKQRWRITYLNLFKIVEAFCLAANRFRFLGARQRAQADICGHPIEIDLQLCERHALLACREQISTKPQIPRHFSSFFFPHRALQNDIRISARLRARGRSGGLWPLATGRTPQNERERVLVVRLTDARRLQVGRVNFLSEAN